MEMAWTISALLLFAVSSLQVHARECYVGQEPDPYSDSLRYRWSLAKGITAECTALRLGGLNMRSHRRLHEEIIGENSRLGDSLRVETGTRPTATSSTGTRHIPYACATATANASHSSQYPSEGLFSSPLERLEFSVYTAREDVPVYMKLRDFKGRRLYGIEIGPVSSASFGIELSSHLWVTYYHGLLQIGKAGSDAPLTHLQDVFSYVIRSISLQSAEPAEWHFYTPCPDDNSEGFGHTGL